MRLSSRLLTSFLTVLLLAGVGRASAQTPDDVAQPATVTVLADGASIWSVPYVPSIILATVKAGTTLEVISHEGLWYRVNLPDASERTGYILARQVELTAGSPPPPRTPVFAERPRGIAPPPRAARRAFISGVVGYQPVSPAFDETQIFTDFIEQGSRTNNFKAAQGVMFDIGYGAEVRRNLFIAGAVSWLDGASDATIDASVPHPFFFNQPRTLEATVEDISREEVGIHLQIAQAVPITRRLYMVAGAGPSFFRLKQSVISNVGYTQEYPFDTIEFSEITSTVQEKSGIGANAQLNIVALVAPNIGVDTLIRFSFGSLTFDGSGGEALKIPAGGVQVGIGLRAQF